MNRKAKRNKYKRLQRELQNQINFWKRKQDVDAFVENSQRQKIRTISVIYNPMFKDRFIGDMDPDTYRIIIAKKMAEELLKHNEFIKCTDTGYGYKYDLLVVKQN
jgi:hypothetical protein